MTQLLHSNSPEVQDAVQDAVQSACKELGRLFPGGNQGGITSNFQRGLEEVVAHMLKGHSLLDGTRGHPLSLPALVVDDSFFGNPLIRGEHFLVTKIHEGKEVALVPGRSCMQPIEHADQTWPSFEAAAKAGFEYLAGAGISHSEAKKMLLQVKVVTPSVD